MVLLEHEQKLDDESRRYLKNVIEGGKRMAQLMDELLTFRRLNRRELQFTEVDLLQVTESVVEQLKAIEPPDRKIEITVHPLPVVHGNEPLRREAITNLISNALKFTWLPVRRS